MAIASHTHQIKIVPVLERIVKPHNPLGPTRGMDQGSGFQNIAFSSDMSLLSLSQHISLSQLLCVIRTQIACDYARKATVRGGAKNVPVSLRTVFQKTSLSQGTRPRKHLQENNRNQPPDNAKQAAKLCKPCPMVLSFTNALASTFCRRSRKYSVSFCLQRSRSRSFCPCVRPSSTISFSIASRRCSRELGWRNRGKYRFSK